MADGLAALSALLRSELAAASSTALLAAFTTLVGVLAVSAEVGWLARKPGGTRTRVLGRTATAASMAAGALAVGFGYTAVLRHLWAGVAALGPSALHGFWRHHAVTAAVVTFVAWDGVGWLYHWIGHRTAIGWAAHQPHHSGVDFDLTLGLRQTWTPVHGLLVQPLLAFAGFEFRTMVACSAVSNLWQLLQHTSTPVRFPPWFAGVFMTPDAHRHHHRREDGRHGAVNLGPVFTLWDRLGGTWVSPRAPLPLAYGPVGRPSSNPVRVEFAGWLALARRWPRAAVSASNGAAAGR